MDSSSESDYCVDEFVKPDKIRKSVNDDSADLLGNFDDVKRQEILDGTYEDKDQSDDEESMSEQESESGEDEEKDEKEEDEVKQDEEMKELPETENGDFVNKTPVGKNGLTKTQIEQLRKGASKTNRYVLYVTNLCFETTRGDLEEYFGSKGSVKSVRIPKKCRGGFAFVEMSDLESFQRGFELHDTELQGRRIKVQFSEGGKKKSANKKNIMRQKNRKLAKMRNEHKTFTKSGKFYDKNIKKEIAHVVEASKRWRKKPGPGGGAPRQK